MQQHLVRSLWNLYSRLFQTFLLLNILREVGQLHVALASQRVVHSEGGGQVMTCLTHLGDLQVVPQQLLVVGMCTVLDDGLCALDGTFPRRSAIPCSVTMMFTSCSELS